MLTVHLENLNHGLDELMEMSKTIQAKTPEDKNFILYMKRRILDLQEIVIDMEEQTEKRQAVREGIGIFFSSTD